MNEKKIAELAMEYGLKCDPKNQTLEKQADIRQDYIAGMNKALSLFGVRLSFLRDGKLQNDTSKWINDLVKVSVRDGADEWHIEGWFKDGQKYVIAEFDYECEGICDEVAALINFALGNEA